jgi:rhodanese-related sulfurtransferase
MIDNEDLVLVNTHIPFEGDLPQTDLSIPYNEIADHLDQLPDKDATIVVYCRSGSMSTSAAAELAQLGYTNVMELDGGFRAWRAAGYELVGID